MEFRFAYPLVLMLALLPPVLHYVYRPAISSMVYSDVRLFDRLAGTWRMRLRYLPDVIRYAAYVLLVVVLARPQTGNMQEVIRGQGIDIVLALDISTSMAALDFEPQNRLETAKAVIGDFIAGRSFDRIGLVVFARNAFHQAPLTLDYDILLQLLADVELVSELRQTTGRNLDGTAIGLGIASSANMLRSSNAPSKVIILLTDGDNNVGLAPLQAAQAADALNIRIYTIGMGKSGMVDIPDAQGIIRTVESDLNDDALREIASAAGGLYFRAEDTAGLQQIYDQIDTLERSDAERRIFVRWRDQVTPLLLMALALLCVERVLRQSVFEALP